MTAEQEVVTTGQRRKTNSERGKEFRAKRKEHEDSLLEIIGSLKDEVQDLLFLRDIRQEQALVSRHSPEGSLARLVREYFSLFARGRPTRLHVGGKRESPGTVNDLLTKQNSFLRQSIDPSVKFGGDAGADALLDQWERYTLYHSSFNIAVVSVEMAGSQESPIVTVTSQMSVKLSRETFRHIFPHVAHDEALVSRLVGRHVVYRGVNQFQFSDDGKRISMYESDVDFVSAFLAAGISFADVATLMQKAHIADQYLLGEEPRTVEALETDGGDTDRFEELPEEEVLIPDGTITSEDEDRDPTEAPMSPKQNKRSCLDRQRIDYLLN